MNIQACKLNKRRSYTQCGWSNPTGINWSKTVEQSHSCCILYLQRLLLPLLHFCFHYGCIKSTCIYNVGSQDILIKLNLIKTSVRQAFIKAFDHFQIRVVVTLFYCFFFPHLFSITKSVLA